MTRGPAAGTGTTRPVVSVIIPVHDEERYVAACVRSVLGQSHRALQVIAVDDGSTDCSPEILRRMADVDPRLTVVTQANAGVSAARNVGLDAAVGDWVMFVDADDRLVDDALIASVVAAAEPTDASIVRFRDTAGGRAGTGHHRVVALDDETLGAMVVSEQINVLWNKAYRRALIAGPGVRFRPDLRMGEDLLFNIGCFRQIESVVQLDVVGYEYRRGNAASATSRYQPDKHRDLGIVHAELDAWARETGGRALLSAAALIRVKNILSCIRDLHHADCALDTREKLAAVRRCKADVPAVGTRGLGRGLGLRERLVVGVYAHAGPRALYTLTGLAARWRRRPLRPAGPSLPPEQRGGHGHTQDGCDGEAHEVRHRDVRPGPRGAQRLGGGAERQP